MGNINEEISKSLDELTNLADNFAKDTVSKAVDDEDLKSNDVSENAPEEPEEGNEEQPTGDSDDQASSEPDVDEDTEGEEDADEDEGVEKSLEEEMKSDEGVRKALEVSEFLDTLVKSISDKMDTFSKSIGSNTEELSKSLHSTEQNQEMLAKSVVGMMQAQKVALEQTAQLQKSVRTLSKRLKEVEAQPLVRKSVQSNAQPINKSFNASAGVAPENTEATLSKSQISSKLFEGVQAGKIEANELLAFEGTGNQNALSSVAKDYLGLQ